jgi:hypothetical protein
MQYAGPLLRSSPTATLVAGICLAAVSGLVGCSSTTLLQTSSSVLNAPAAMLQAARTPDRVSKLLCLWEAAEGQGLDEKPARGFAGQIMFFTHGKASPIKVNAVVRIFEYVNYDSDDENPIPTHMFTFDSGAWNAHRAEGTLGQSYNVFLPYVKKDKGHAVCALRVEIETEDGRKISSPFTEVTLASKTSNRAAKGIQRDVVRKAQHSSSQVEKAEPVVARKLESMTIQLPSGR